MLVYLKNILQLVISPDNGWEDIDKDRSSIRAFKGLVWMVSIAAISIFIQLFYSRHIPLVAMFQSVIAVLISCWATYVIGRSVMSSWIPRLNGGVADTELVGLLSAYSVSLLSIQIIITDIMPLTFAILELWPIYVVVIMWRGMSVLGIPVEATGKYLLAVILGFIIPSQLLFRVFNAVIMQ